MTVVALIRRFAFVVLAVAWLGAACRDSSDDAEPQGDGDGDAAISPSACAGSTKAELCTEFCEAMCQGQELYCLASACEPDECSADGEIFQICDARCEDDQCALELCEVLHDISCEAFGSEVDGTFESYCLGLDPSCDIAPELGCSDVCGSEDAVGGDLADNGLCEDGRDVSDSAVCTRGTDCTDCGPHVCVQPGDECTTHGDCCGFEVGPGGLCVDLDGDPAGGESPICVAGCDEEHPCPTGFRCTMTTIDHSVCVPS